MATSAQLAANTANAQHSTGPRSPEGKARSAQNARTHGLTSRDLVVAEHELPEFEDFQSSLLDEVRPHGELEASLFHQFLHAAWNLRRFRRLEVELLQNEPNSLLDDKIASSFERLSRYRAHTERSYYHALKELKDLQTNRLLREGLEEKVNQALPDEEHSFPALVRVEVLTKQARIEIADELQQQRRQLDLYINAPPPGFSIRDLGAGHCAKSVFKS